MYDDDEIQSYCNVCRTIYRPWKIANTSNIDVNLFLFLAILVLGIKMVGVDNFYKCHLPRTRTALPEGESNEEHNDDTDYVLKNIMITQEPWKSSWKTLWKLLSTRVVFPAVQDVRNHTVVYIIELKM